MVIYKRNRDCDNVQSIHVNSYYCIALHLMDVFFITFNIILLFRIFQKINYTIKQNIVELSVVCLRPLSKIRWSFTGLKFWYNNSHFTFHGNNLRRIHLF